MRFTLLRRLEKLEAILNCDDYDLKKLSDEELEDRLRMLCEKAGIKYPMSEEESREQITQLRRELRDNGMIEVPRPSGRGTMWVEQGKA